jgi:DNA-binding GntR family transcriptional regulator
MNSVSAIAASVTAAPASFRATGSLAQELARFLEEQIVFCELAPGARLTEDDVCTRSGISRSPVREAFRLLAADGLVVHSARRGIRVSPVSRRDLAEVQACRIELEGLAAAEAARNASAPDRDALRAVLARMAAARDARDARTYFRENVAFTTLIHAASRNRTLQRLLNGIGRQALRYRYIAYQEVPALMDVSLPGNRRILTAIRDRDAARARELTATLIRGSWEAIAPHIPEDEGDAAR